MMEAGRELDALIAEKVMGWVWRRGEHWDITSVPGDRQLHLLESDDEIRQQRPGEFTSIGDWPPQDGRIIWSHMPAYSTDIAAAWLIVEERPQGWSLYTLCDIQQDDEAWQCDLWRKSKTGEFEYVSAIGSSAPHAICLAALNALGIDKT